MDPLLGYKTAKALLEDRFGNPFKVTTAYLKEVTNGPPVRPHDSKALLAFADKLKRLYEWPGIYWILGGNK